MKFTINPLTVICINIKLKCVIVDLKLDLWSFDQMVIYT